MTVLTLLRLDCCTLVHAFNREGQRAFQVLVCFAVRSVVAAAHTRCLRQPMNETELLYWCWETQQ